MGHKPGAVYQRPASKRTPAKKKSLSYAKDCRNAYGESNKGPRKIIPAFKAQSKRLKRRVVAIALRSERDPDVAQNAVKAVEDKPPYKMKDPDTPLGEVIASKRRHRD